MNLQRAENAPTVEPIFIECTQLLDLLRVTPRTDGESKKVQALFFHFCIAMVILNYWMAAKTDAGGIPRTAEWRHGLGKTIEMKADGEKRYCKWCDVYLGVALGGNFPFKMVPRNERGVQQCFFS